MDTLHSWAWRIALIITVLVALLSLLSGVSLLMAVLRGIFGFILIYGLSEVSLYFFEKTGPDIEAKSEFGSGSNANLDLGALLDIAVGQDSDSLPEGDKPGPGNADALSAVYGQTAYGKGGLGKSVVAGQVNQELAQGLPNEEVQAQIVRQMGWGE